MPGPDKKLKKRKTVSTPGKNTRVIIKRKKTNKHKCAISNKPLFGMPHGKRVYEVARMSKTQRRGENPLASFISPDLRKRIYLEAVMLKKGIISYDDIDLRHKRYIEMIYNKIE